MYSSTCFENRASKTSNTPLPHPTAMKPGKSYLAPKIATRRQRAERVGWTPLMTHLAGTSDYPLREPLHIVPPSPVLPYCKVGPLRLQQVRDRLPQSHNQRPDRITGQIGCCMLFGPIFSQICFRYINNQPCKQTRLSPHHHHHYFPLQFIYLLHLFFGTWILCLRFWEGQEKYDDFPAPGKVRMKQ